MMLHSSISTTRNIEAVAILKSLCRDQQIIYDQILCQHYRTKRRVCLLLHFSSPPMNTLLCSVFSSYKLYLYNAISKVQIDRSGSFQYLFSSTFFFGLICLYAMPSITLPFSANLNGNNQKGYLNTNPTDWVLNWINLYHLQSSIVHVCNKYTCIYSLQ